MRSDLCGPSYECKCPMCERTHKARIEYWAGRGTPRIYCHTCYINNIQGQVYDTKTYFFGLIDSERMANAI
jgi:hypothetical protein